MPQRISSRRPEIMNPAVPIKLEHVVRKRVQHCSEASLQRTKGVLDCIFFLGNPTQLANDHGKTYQDKAEEKNEQNPN
jgi:hypothetical protein